MPTRSTEPRVSELELQISNVRRRLSQLVNGVVYKPAAVADRLVEIESLLKTIPLARREFGAASNGLHRARRYLRSGEFGAACYELKLLLGTVLSRWSSTIAT